MVVEEALVEAGLVPAKAGAKNQVTSPLTSDPMVRITIITIRSSRSPGRVEKTLPSFSLGSKIWAEAVEARIPSMSVAVRESVKMLTIMGWLASAQARLNAQINMVMCSAVQRSRNRTLVTSSAESVGRPTILRLSV